MFLVEIEGEERELHDTCDVAEFIEDKVHFEVDTIALLQDLRFMRAGETLTLRDDCKVKRL